jgi:hypothetical protein
VAFAAGDLIRFRVLGTSTPVAQVVSVGATFAPTVDGNSFYVGGQMSLSNSSSLFWWNGPSNDGGNGTARNRAVISNACTLTALYAQAKTTPVGGDSWTYNLLQNEAQVATVSTTTANVVSSAGLSITVADDDRLEMGHVPAGTPATSFSIWSVAIFVQPGIIATNESGEASALTGFGGFQGPASTNESGEASALSGINGIQGTASTNESGETSSALGSFGFSGDVETDSAGISTTGAGANGFSGDVETDEGGLASAGTGAFGIEGDLETDSAGLTTDGTGAFGFDGDVMTDSGGLTTDGSGEVGTVEDSITTIQGGLQTSGAGHVGSVHKPPKLVIPAGWTAKFTKLRRKFSRKKAPRVILSVSIEGKMRTSSSGGGSRAVGTVGLPRPAAAPVAQPSLVAPAALPPARASIIERILPKKRQPVPRAITGSARTASGGIAAAGRGQVRETETEMLLAAIMITEDEE